MRFLPFFSSLAAALGQAGLRIEEPEKPIGRMNPHLPMPALNKITLRQSALHEVLIVDAKKAGADQRIEKARAKRERKASRK
jgi:hypothetical protein